MRARAMAARACAEMARPNSFRTVTLDTPLLSLVEMFAKGCHRCAVQSDNCNLLGVVSQSTVLRVLGEALIAEFPDIVSRTVGELHLGATPVVGVKESDTVQTALSRMHEHKISNVAVLDEDGTIFGNLSLADVKIVFRSRRFSSLRQSVRDYITAIRRTDMESREHEKAHWPYYWVKKDSTLETAIRRLIATRAHHLFLIDDQRHVKAVISLSDIFHVLVPGVL